MYPVEGDSTYKLSYLPQCDPERRKPVKTEGTDNLLNADSCFDECTTYGLSYRANCVGDRQMPFHQKDNYENSNCPLAHDTVNKV